MAAGCAVVTSDTPPQRRMLGDGVLYVRPGDAQSLAETLIRLLANGDALNEERTRSMQRAASFTAAKVTKKLVIWISDLLASGN